MQCKKGFTNSELTTVTGTVGECSENQNIYYLANCSQAETDVCNYDQQYEGIEGTF